ncbi:uncharacterized protein LOC108624655 isoform X2 [Ceratina calcarata]|uniref:Uncharacterized protein LOC108624655 isoform X2 n=1 Tax=Ceratina calcarata TaxID=156304 RepID=A0AAJ7S1L3_9HYME|nr:uncharacterized protein LOC108624655 isoform X2 [Ceratina calcarata]
MRENFKKKFPWILVDEQGKEKTVTQSSDLKQVPDVDGALVEGTVATGITDSKRRDKKSASKKNPKGANVERTIEEKVKGVNRIEISEMTKRFPDKSQLGKKVNEIARERKRQRTTYLGHTQPYDWNLLYEYTKETASLDSNV